MEKLAVNVRPKFLKSVAAKATQESESRADGRIPRRVVARSTPRVGQKVATGDRHQTRVGGHHAAIAILSHEGHLGCMSNAMGEWRLGITEITRVFTPDGAQPCFHCIADRDSALPHAIAIPKPFPMRAVRLRLVEFGSPPGAKKSGHQALRPNSALDY